MQLATGRAKVTQTSESIQVEGRGWMELSVFVLFVAQCVGFVGYSAYKMTLDNNKIIQKQSTSNLSSLSLQ